MLRIIQSVPSPKAEPVRQWLAQVGAQRLEEVAAGLPEEQKRLLLRGEVAEKNSLLADTVTIAGVVTRRDFAIFQDHGYMGLYAGERARDIAERKGLARGEHILDWMGSTELAANWFRITQAEEKLTATRGMVEQAGTSPHPWPGRAHRHALLHQGEGRACSIDVRVAVCPSPKRNRFGRAYAEWESACTTRAEQFVADSLTTRSRACARSWCRSSFRWMA